MNSLVQVREGMIIEFNVPIKARDGLELRANIYRPIEEGRYPTVFSYGPYGKDLHVEDLYKNAWESILKDNPSVGVGSTNIHQSWEVVDPEKWVPDGYVCVRVDSRGQGNSPGFNDPFSQREAMDCYDCIEWCAKQNWSNGKIGICGISYYAIMAWQTAELQPPHLAAIIAWEGNNDLYRDSQRQGGILELNNVSWEKKQIMPVQYGLGINGFKSRAAGFNVSGDVNMTNRQLTQNRVEFEKDILAGHEMLDDYYKSHSVQDLGKVLCPTLSCGNWGGHGLHLRGNVEGFMRAGAREKFLEMHGNTHFSLFYSDYGMKLQKQFFGYYLKGENTGWKDRKPVALQIRHIGEKFVERFEDEFPLARAKYTRLYLNPKKYSLDWEDKQQAGAVTYKGLSSDGVTFMTTPFEEETEITGHIFARLTISSSTKDADLFLVLRLFSPDMAEITFIGANDPNTPISLGWLRASHRKMDPEKSLPYRPWHTHDEKWPLEPGVPVVCDVEIWPTCIVIPKGYRLAITIRGKDYVNAGAADGHIWANYLTRPQTGVGALTHDNVLDRPPEIFDGDVTIHFGEGKENFIQVPIIPENK